MELIDVVEEKAELLQEKHGFFKKKNNLRRKLFTSVIVVCVCLVGILSAWIAGRVQMKKKYEDLLKEPAIVNPVAPEIVLDIVESELNGIGELATVEYLFTDAAKYSDSKQIKDWNIPFTEKSFIMKWNGKIKAGIRIDEIKIDIREITNTIQITLPAAEILSYEMDNDSIELIDEKDNIFNNISIEDRVQLDIAVEEEMKERAIENGLLDMAQQNAEATIAKLLCLNPNITNGYTIEFISE